MCYISNGLVLITVEDGGVAFEEGAAQCEEVDLPLPSTPKTPEISLIKQQVSGYTVGLVCSVRYSVCVCVYVTCTCTVCLLSPWELLLILLFVSLMYSVSSICP